MAYARSDTHYLLYIYDQLRRDLSARSKDTNRDMITDVLDSSRKIAMLSYVRERYDYEEGSGTDGWRKLLLNNKGPRLHSNLQLTVFKRVHQWRDQIAREEDESVNYVLPNRSLMNLAASLPHSMQAVVAACHPVPPLVQVYAEDIAYIVQRTRKELAEEAAKAEATASEAIGSTVDSQHRNGVTGATHVWYKDENTAPNGVKSVIEAVRHGAQFNVWGEQTDRLHTLVMSTSKFWEPLDREYKVRDPIHEVGGELEDVTLSVPLPPLTAQIYMTAEDVKAMETPEVKRDNVASLAEHPFVQKSREEANQQKSGPEIIIARKLGKKEKKREREVDTEPVNGDSLPTADDQPIRSKSRSKRRKGLKEKMDVVPKNKPVEQFNPYKIEDPQRKSEKGHKNKGPSSGKSMTFVTQKG
jgi:exosome complex exonuclease RRP6